MMVQERKPDDRNPRGARNKLAATSARNEPVALEYTRSILRARDAAASLAIFPSPPRSLEKIFQKSKNNSRKEGVDSRSISRPVRHNFSLFSK